MFASRMHARWPGYRGRNGLHSDAARRHQPGQSLIDGIGERTDRWEHRYGIGLRLSRLFGGNNGLLFGRHVPQAVGINVDRGFAIRT